MEEVRGGDSTKEFMTPNSSVINESPNNEALSLSIIAKIQSCVNDKKCDAMLTETLKKTERVNNLMRIRWSLECAMMLSNQK